MNIDWVQMIGNLSRSLMPVQTLIAGGGYLLGILLVITAIGKFRKIGDARANSGSSEKMFVPVAYLLGGAALIFLPSSLMILSNTAFGTNNVLQYTPFNPYDFQNAILFLIKTAGVIWFIRGCILLVHSSEPGVNFGGKGLLFVISGILTMNFEATTAALNYIMNGLLHITHIT